MSVLSPPASPLAARPLPAYQLYGERGGAHETEQLHLETISARSQLHDWEIQPHRHPSLFQILHIHQGLAQAQVDGQTQALRGPCALTVPAMVAHGFRFDPGVQGQVITVQDSHLARLLAGTPALLASLVSQPLLGEWRPGGQTAGEVHQAVQALAEEYGGRQDWRTLALDVTLTRLLLLLSRGLARPNDATAAQGRPALAHAQRYRALVESRFRLQPRVADLAAELGITATQLNRVCRAALGQSALAVLHGRMLLEAQRQLTYTTLSVKRIGLELGFTDPGYFTRFFQRGCGLSPSAWRQRAGD
jgi:AraC family transcriptional regulator, transcriptional activator of pobA